MFLLSFEILRIYLFTSSFEAPPPAFFIVTIVAASYFYADGKFISDKRLSCNTAVGDFHSRIGEVLNEQGGRCSLTIPNFLQEGIDRDKRV